MVRTKPVVVVKLTVLDLNDQHPVRTFELRAPSYAMRIGRSSRSEGTKTIAAANNGFFDSRVISREHAVIKAYPETKTVFIEDLGSMHGTFINDRKVRPRQQEMLAAYDTLRFGAVVARGPDIFPALRATFHYEFINETKSDLTSEIEEVFLVSDDEGSDIEFVQESIRNPDFADPNPSHTFSVPDSDISAAGSFVSDDNEADDEELDYEPPDNFLPASARAMMEDTNETALLEADVTSPETVSREASSQMRQYEDLDVDADQVQSGHQATEVIPETVPADEPRAQSQFEELAPLADKEITLTRLLTDADLAESDDDSVFSEPTSLEESDGLESDDSSSMNSEDGSAVDATTEAQTPPFSPTSADGHHEGGMRTPPWGFSVGTVADERMKTPPPFPGVFSAMPRPSKLVSHIHDQAPPARLPSPSDAAMPKPRSAAQERSITHLTRSDSFPGATQPYPSYSSWYPLPVENYDSFNFDFNGHYAQVGREPDSRWENTENGLQANRFPMASTYGCGASNLTNVNDNIPSVVAEPSGSSQTWTDVVTSKPIPAPKPRSSTKVTIDEIVEKPYPLVQVTSSSSAETESQTESFTTISKPEMPKLKRKAAELEDNSDGPQYLALMKAQAEAIPIRFDTGVKVAQTEERPQKKAKIAGSRPAYMWGTHAAAAGAGVLVGFVGVLGTLLALPQDLFPGA